MNWTALFKAAAKVVGVALAGAAAGFETTGTWQGAALGAATAVGGLFVKRPTLQPEAPS